MICNEASHSLHYPHSHQEKDNIMNNFLSDRAKQIKPSATVAANDKAKALAAKGVDIINLTAGQPDFPTPDFAKNAGIEAIQDNKTGYTPVDGVPEIKKYLSNDIDLNKTDKLLKIILFAAVFELLFKHNNPKKVIISEYLKTSHFFLEKAQIKYLNAILDKLSDLIRKN